MEDTTYYPQVGDRVEMVNMPDDPDPILPGTRGIVDRVTDFRAGLLGREAETHVEITWDNGRTLKAILPIDTLKKVSEHEPT